MKWFWMAVGLSAYAQIGYLGSAFDGVAGVSGIDGCEWIARAPNDKHVYATGSSAGSLAVFERLASGDLAFVASYFDGMGGVDGLAGAQGVVVSPDDLDVYVTGSAEDKVAHFMRDTFTGELTFVAAYGNELSGPTSMIGPVRVALEPGGKHLYVSCVTSGAVVVYRRDTVTGDLTYASTVIDNVGGFDGLEGATGLAFESSGRFLHVCGSSESAIAVLERDSMTGALSMVAVYRDGLGGVDGIGGASDVAVSGRYLYATGFGDSGLAMFRRTLATGLLSFIEAEFDGVGGVDGLGGAIGVAVSPDGLQIVASGFSDNALAVFERLGESLTFRQLRRDGESGVDGLEGVVGVVASADGDHVYATGFTDDSVAQFETLPTLGSIIATWADLASILDLVSFVSTYP